MMGLLQFLKDQVAEPVVVPEKLTKEDLIEWSKKWAEIRTNREIWYFPISPEMHSIMLRMIDESPDGGYVIKTTRDESK